MVRQVARQFCRLREDHSLAYGRRASGENGHKLTASTRVGSESRLMDYLGLIGCGRILFAPGIAHGHEKSRGSNSTIMHYMYSASTRHVFCFCLV